MTDVDRTSVARCVEHALRDALGYDPSTDEDLTGAMDSMQKLEIVVTLEESLGVDLDEESLDGDWWASRSGIIAYFENAASAPKS